MTCQHLLARSRLTHFRLCTRSSRNDNYQVIAKIVVLQFPELTLQLIFFDGEEALKRWEGDDNTYGARDLAKKWEKTPYQSNGIAGDHNDRIDLFVLLDLIGAKDPSFLALQRSTAVSSCVLLS